MILISVILILTIALLGYILTLKDTHPAEKQKNRQNSAEENREAKNRLTKKENEIELLREKLKATQEECLRLKEELGQAKNGEALLQEELNKIKSWSEKDKSQEENTKKELFELKDKLLKKDQECEREFALALSLRKELNEYKQKVENLESLNRASAEGLRILEAQNNGYKEELKSQGQVIAELKKKNQDSQWVSKKEYDQLKAQVKGKEDNEEKL